MNILIDKLVREFGIECDFVKNGLEDLECREVDVNKYPQIAFELIDLNGNSFMIELEGRDYINRCYLTITLQRKCLLNLQVLEGDEIVLGVALMQKYYINFNIQNKTIGLAESLFYGNLINSNTKKDKNNLSSRDFFIKSYHSYIPVLIIFVMISLIMIIFYISIRISILKSMRLYESVLEKSSARSDREQEMTNLKTK
jgi:hypothetical protein